MVLSKCRGTAMIIEWLKKTNTTKTLLCKDCKFYDNGLCSKQEMKCYFTDKTQCDIFELDMNVNAMLLLNVPEVWFTKKYLSIIYKNINKLKDPHIKEIFTKNIFKKEKRFETYDIAEEWVNALFEWSEKTPTTTIEATIKKLQSKPTNRPTIQKTYTPIKPTKICKVCGVRPTILNQDICVQCKQKKESLKTKFESGEEAFVSSDNTLNRELVDLLEKAKQNEHSNKTQSLEKIFIQCKKTAGCWFIVNYIKDIEANYDKFADMTYKTNYAKKIFEETSRDCKPENTLVRVNCMLRLVRYGLVDRAYDYAINSRYY